MNSPLYVSIHVLNVLFRFVNIEEKPFLRMKRKCQIGRTDKSLCSIVSLVMALIALTAIPGPIFLCAAANRCFLFLFNETLGHDDVIATFLQIRPKSNPTVLWLRLPLVRLDDSSHSSCLESLYLLSLMMS